mgnify:FL=1
MIFSPFERLVARRYLRARRKEGFISVIAGFSLAGIALGVATLIIVMSVMNGFRGELMGRILGLNGHLGVSSALSRGLTDFDAVAERLRGVDGVIRVTPISEGQAMATVRGNAAGVLVRGMRIEDIRSHPILSKSIVEGDLTQFDADTDIVIGSRFAARQGIAIGDRITLIAPRIRATAFGSVPRMKSFRVRAIFEIGMFEYDSTFLFVSLKAAQTFFRTGDGAVSSLEVMLSNADAVDKSRRTRGGISPFCGPWARPAV